MLKFTWSSMLSSRILTFPSAEIALEIPLEMGAQTEGYLFSITVALDHFRLLLVCFPPSMTCEEAFGASAGSSLDEQQQIGLLLLFDLGC